MTAAIEPSSGTKDQQGAPAAEPTTGAETPFSFGASLRQFGTSIVDQGSRILSSGQELVITQAGNLRDAVSSASEQVYERSTRALRYSLRALASDPEKGPGLIDNIVNLAPVLGTTRMYATAWQKFQHGTETKNPEMIREAKRECLIAVVNAGLDITTLGVGAIARTGFSAVIKGASTARLAIVNPDLKEKLVDPVFDAALAAPQVEKMVTALLTSLEPARGTAEKTDENPATPQDETRPES